jgi:hypothetical protein
MRALDPLSGRAQGPRPQIGRFEYSLTGAGHARASRPLRAGQTALGSMAHPHPPHTLGDGRSGGSARAGQPRVGAVSGGGGGMLGGAGGDADGDAIGVVGGRSPWRLSSSIASSRSPHDRRHEVRRVPGAPACRERSCSPRPLPRSGSGRPREPQLREIGARGRRQNGGSSRDLTRAQVDPQQPSAEGVPCVQRAAGARPRRGGSGGAGRASR